MKLGLVLAIALAAAGAGCGSVEDDGGGAPQRAELEVVVSPGPGAEERRYAVSCDPPSGDVPDAAAACAALRRLGAAAFAPTPPETACTEIYGGPQTARVTGTIDGEAVAATLSRENGCEIARWERVEAVVPLPPAPAG